jgi:hypothetical protein
MSTTSTSDLNRRGVALLQQNRRKEAMCTFRAAMEAIKMMTNIIKRDGHVPTKSDRLGDEPRCIYSAAICDDDTVETTRLESSPDSSFVPYDRAFLVCAKNSLTSYEYLEVSSAVLLFNMGLLYHGIGVREESTVDFNMALQLYNTSLIVLTTSHVYSQPRPDLTLLRMAIINNTGHINSHFFNKGKTSHCLHMIKETFATLNCPDEMRSEFAFFYQGLLFMSSQHVMGLAPAA